jgi:hypothetical protein
MIEPTTGCAASTVVVRKLVRRAELKILTRYAESNENFVVVA